MTYEKLKSLLSDQILSGLYSTEEATTMFYMLLENNTGWRRVDFSINRNNSVDDVALWENQIERLAKGEPVQHVIGWADFRGLKFKVDRHVLIPRPETEEMVDLIVKNHLDYRSLSILDIGTGSGCIAIALKKELINAHVTGIDISEEAILLANKNAQSNQSVVDFIHCPIEDFKPNSRYDIIVSNPPYIPITESDNLERNVRDFEPHIALFAPDEDPLYFYTKIAQFAQKHLIKPNGRLYFEAHHIYSKEVFKQMNKLADAQLINDMFGKPRFIEVAFCND